jgi:hypothetical protein
VSAANVPTVDHPLGRSKLVIDWGWAKCVLARDALMLRDHSKHRHIRRQCLCQKTCELWERALQGHQLAAAAAYAQHGVRGLKRRLNALADRARWC